MGRAKEHAGMMGEVGLDFVGLVGVGVGKGDKTKDGGEVQ